ncbi:UNVERIFIED_CONTAM: Dual specificity protein phosphatase PHS1 [Sesamum radiatum]|uniref:Dual specificity protein phosphatase PHS1 n=1 Tax=Sesamum radiatum TaxID=300843 RepID=A0AAW2PFC1_SESRA
MLDIESSTFSWSTLSSLHHTEHSSSTEHSEDEMNKALEVTVNSGVLFALFNQPENDESSPKEAAAVIKFSSSRMATQSERLGYEFAKWLGVRTPQVVPSYFKYYVTSQVAWELQTYSWLKKYGANIDALEVAFDSAIKRYRPKVIRALQKERRATSIDSRLSPPQPGLAQTDVSEIESPKSSNSVRSLTLNESCFPIHILAIDSGVPRRPPAGKRDQANYPKLVELLINSSEYALQLLHEITGGKLGASPELLMQQLIFVKVK